MSLAPFANEPFLDLASPTEAARMREAVAMVASRLGGRYPLRIGGERVAGATTLRSMNPGAPDELVGEIAAASAAQAAQAVEAAGRAFPAWSRIDPWERAATLLRAADILRQRRRELLAWLAFEVGKNFGQGDGEVAEAIDHFEWNARQLLAWQRGREIQPIPSEMNEYRYRPLGVGVVISPWNFPSTLPLGMVVAAVAAGNAVVLKPAEEASVIASQLVDVLEEAGLPPGVVNLVTGTGAEAGDALVRHPDVRFVAFVGSRDVGTRVYEKAAALAPGQRHLKRVMTEMGGKNATIVTEAAELEWAAAETARAALGYQGQKCSATSRVVVTEGVHDRFVAALEAEVRRIASDRGQATDNRAFGPLINRAALEKVERYMALAPSQGRVVLRGERDESVGHCVTPTLVDDVEPGAAIAQEEIFGPFVSVLRAPSLERAVAIANDVPYALTGAAFTRDPAELDYVRAHFYVGNLYLNRSSTGAMAGVHPFGGYKLSGTGPKVGGPDYMGFFLEAQAITQKVRYARTGIDG